MTLRLADERVLHVDAAMTELRRPRPDDEAAFLAARAAVPADHPAFLRDYRPGMAYADYLRLLEDHRAGRGLPDDVAPSTFLFAFAGDCIVGRASVRHALVPPQGEIAGHIGYSVLPAFRNRGHATRILRAAVRFAHDELGLARVLVTCDDDNAASIRVIEKCHGVFADVRADAALRRPKRRYWIDAADAPGRTAQNGGA
jgi:predicted acetyltransferase